MRIEDPVKALQLIDEASALYSDLAKKAADKKYTGLEQLGIISTNIKNARQEIQKAEQSPAHEFYDLSLIRSGASAQKLYLSDDQLAMLDSKNGRVYVLEVSSKSVDTVSSKEVRDAQFIGLHQGNAFVFNNGAGVTKFIDNKSEKVIPNDKDWKGIKDMGLFNGNIYVLAEGNDEVYKYLVAEGGYSDKTSYFKTGQAEDMSDSQAMSIDSAIYIVKPSKVLKYASGLKEAFNITVPEKESEFDDIYTSAALDNVYVMDKKHATIFIFDKDGVFQKQVASAVIAKADDFVVDQEEGILVLSRNKIYQIKQNN